MRDKRDIEDELASNIFVPYVLNVPKKTQKNLSQKSKNHIEMHWYWVDRITVFESQNRAESIKVVSLAEEHLHDHFPYYPVMPASLIIEGIAQTAGLLLYEAKGYKEKVVLAKIPRFTLYDVEVKPGEVLKYKVKLESVREDGGVAAVWAYRDDELFAEGELMFAHLGGNFADQSLFADGDMIDMMRLLRVFDVGVGVDGKKLIPPETPKNNFTS